MDWHEILMWTLLFITGLMILVGAIKTFFF